MSPGAEPFVCGLVLAAGGSSRLGRPKQLLAFGPATLLDHTVRTARACRFDQLIVTVGGGADEIRSRVDLSGVEVVQSPRYAEGCSSSIAAALGAVSPQADVLVLLLGDQPGVGPATVAALLAGRGDADLAICAYDDAPGHPFAFGRALLGELGALRGDKGVWKLVARMGQAVVRVPVPGPVPLDVDTWEDYERVLAAAGAPT